MSEPAVVRIAADRLIDGTGAAPVEGVEIVVRDGRIAAIEPAGLGDGALRFAGATVMRRGGQHGGRSARSG